MRYTQNVMTGFTDKYALNPQQSLFLAKKKWDENIYCGMRMENRNVTFPQTQTILQGVNVGSLALDDIQAILNMRDAWKYTLDTITEPLSLSVLCKMNEYISRNESLEWGVLGSGSVGISGVSYTPPIPVQEKVEEELAAILEAKKSATEKALDLFLWGTRAQLFGDGNKRTSLLSANKLLVSAGKGMLTITERNMADFNALLAAWYETGDREPLKSFLWEHAISGMSV
ncbi:hypothetical protein AGMMS49579_25080 [Spirochaetia bacterium]|nr:hypothetical protein AGMMS49579_25080 [Spirochaetia bacterium]